jgi:Flp pilus assembly protein TadD
MWLNLARAQLADNRLEPATEAARRAATCSPTTR